MVRRRVGILRRELERAVLQAVDDVHGDVLAGRRCGAGRTRDRESLALLLAWIWLLVHRQREEPRPRNRRPRRRDARLAPSPPCPSRNRVRGGADCPTMLTDKCFQRRR